MAVQLANIKHDGGTHEVSVETEYGQCVIKFGGSFTLRVDESNLSKLREMIHIAARDLTIERRDTSGARESNEISLTDLKAAEEVFIQAGINAREITKAKNRDTYDPNDPVNW
jgi:hypothetical protein